MQCARRHFKFRYRSAARWIEIFRDFYGPTHKVYAALDAECQARLTADITALLSRMNTGRPNTLVAPSEYLEVVVTKR